MDMLHIAICDDEKIFIDKEKDIISKYLSYKKQEFRIDTYLSGEELLRNLAKQDKYDVVFLDIRMFELDGIETAKRLRKLTKDIYIIFVSAVHKFSLEGYKVKAFRYIVKKKDTMHGELLASLEDLLEQMKSNNPKIDVKIRKTVIHIAYTDIIYAESRLHNVIFHLPNNKIRKIKGKLDDIEKRLNDDRFCRTHQSYLLNLEYADRLHGDKIELIDKETEIPVTRSKFRNVKEQFLVYRGQL